MVNLARESYVNKELEKWKEKYVIPFEQEFQLHAMLSLQHQFLTAPDDHVKTKKDLIDAIQRISNSLRIKPVLADKPFKVLVVTKMGQYEELVNMFSQMLETEDILKHATNNMRTEMTTRNYSIEITNGKLESLRGKRADYILNLTGDSEIDDYFRSH